MESSNWGQKPGLQQDQSNQGGQAGSGFQSLRDRYEAGRNAGSNRMGVYRGDSNGQDYYRDSRSQQQARPSPYYGGYGRPQQQPQ